MNRIKVRAAQLAIVVFVVGGWELSARMGWVDVFLYGRPSLVWSQLSTWVMHGTDLGPLGAWWGERLAAAWTRAVDESLRGIAAFV